MGKTPSKRNKKSCTTRPDLGGGIRKRMFTEITPTTVETLAFAVVDLRVVVVVVGGLEN